MQIGKKRGRGYIYDFYYWDDSWVLARASCFCWALLCSNNGGTEMIQFIETSYESKNGLNIYRSEASAGFVLKAGSIRFRMRWSKRVKQFFWGFI